MQSLYLLQYTCLVFMLINAIFVAGSRLHVRWVNRRYEQSRWMIVGAFLLLALQFLGQMMFGFRMTGDRLGAIVNILLYAPSFSLISLAIYNVETIHTRLRRMVLVCVSLYLAIVLVFVLEQSRVGFRGWFYVMLVLFGASMAYCIVMIVQAMISHKRMLEMMAATDMLPFVRYARASLVTLLLPAIAIPFAMLSTPMLYVVGPLGLLAVIFFSLTFIALGNSYTPTEELLDERANGNNAIEPLSAEREKTIREALEAWVEANGYKDSSVNMLTLSRSINISKNELKRYFDQVLNMTFRIWLSDIRFNAAKKMMLDFPEYSNDAISEECGFSSHSHLYRIFKAREACTPADWRKRRQSMSV